MTEQYNEIRAQLDSKEESVRPEQECGGVVQVRASPAELGSLVQASRASTRSVDLQLRALELAQARARADMLAACLPDHFMATSRDHDAIMLILLLRRLNTKADIILGQIREKFPAVNVWDREVITKTHTAVQYSFRCQLEYQLHMIQCLVSMWSEALETCSPEQLLRAAGALPDAAAQERALDALTALLRANELDENCALEEETPVKVAEGVAAGEVNEALQHQIKVLSWTVERERAARMAAARRADRGAVRALSPLQHPAAPEVAARRRAALQLERDLAKLHAEWTLFVARSGLVKFPDDPSKYGKALQQHKEKQREIRRQIEERLAALQAEARNLLMLHRPWRCVEADFAEFPVPELAAVINPKTVKVGTIRYPASETAQTNEDTVYVTPSQLAKLRDSVTELQSEDVKLELAPLDDTVCAA